MPQTSGKRPFFQKLLTQTASGSFQCVHLEKIRDFKKKFASNGQPSTKLWYFQILTPHLCLLSPIFVVFACFFSSVYRFHVQYLEKGCRNEWSYCKIWFLIKKLCHFKVVCPMQYLDGTPLASFYFFTFVTVLHFSVVTDGSPDRWYFIINPNLWREKT